MPAVRYEINPVEHITTGAVGPPGQRVFYLQGWDAEQTLTLIVEKQQIQSLAVGLEQFLEDLHSRFPDLPPAESGFDELEMALREPLDPLFRAGNMALGYDDERDMMVLVVHQILLPDQEPDEAASVRFWCTRSQLRKMCQWGLVVADRGRPICGNCGEPIDPGGHFCPKRNGHKH